MEIPAYTNFGRVRKSCDIILSIEILTYFPIQSALFMAIRALSIRGLRAPFPCKLSVAAFTVFVVSNIELPDSAIPLGRIVTAGAFLDRLPLLPDVLSVLILVVTPFTGFNVTVGMF
jgi:hypothetical protein